eukprot:1150930-Pelagomonas_calceolata.AAC.1
MLKQLAPDALLSRLLSTLVTKIRHGLLLVTLLIPIGYNGNNGEKPVTGSHRRGAIGINHPLENIRDMSKKNVQPNMNNDAEVLIRKASVANLESAQQSKMDKAAIVQKLL